MLREGYALRYKMGALIVHGMGSQGPSFADKLVTRLNTTIKDQNLDPGEIRWMPVYWAPVLQAREDHLWRELSRDHDLRYGRLRKFVISAFGDAVAYLTRVPTQPKDVYTLVHERVRDCLAELREEMGGRDHPTVVIAHSLGSVIMSNYIWDEQTDQGFGRTALERMETLAGFYTFGCNIAVVSLAYSPVKSITFPPPGLLSHFPAETSPAEVQRAARWLNFYGRNDVLGYPLKPLGASYNAAVTADIQVKVGSIITSWNPLSHSAYWQDKDFVRPVGKAIADVLRLL